MQGKSRIRISVGLLAFVALNRFIQECIKSERSKMEIDKTATVTQTKLMARCSDNDAIRELGKAVRIAVAQRRRVVTAYERDWADWMCWVVFID